MPAQPRTCVACRGRDDRKNMVRLVLRESAIAVDFQGKMAGRGAWIHPNESCVTFAMSGKCFGRAFRAQGIDARALGELKETVLNTPPVFSPEEKAGRNPMGTR